MKYTLAIIFAALVFGALADNAANHTGGPFSCQAHDFTAAEISKALLTINNVRLNFANNKYNTGLQKASNMKVLKWDPIIASMAHDWATHCPHGNSPAHRHEGHDNSTDVKQWVVSISGCKEFHEPQFDKVFEHIVKDLHDSKIAHEKLSSTYNPAHKRSSIDRALTLSLWAETGYMGCSYSNYHLLNTDHYRQVIVCHFLNGGNVPNKPLYIPGEPCSGCSHACSAVLHGLCEHDEVHSHHNDSHTVNNNTHNDTLKQECVAHAFSQTEKDNLVDRINKERSAIATGKYATLKHDKFTGFPAAADMRQMNWDAALENSAKTVASKCKPSNASDTSAHYMEVFFGMGSVAELTHPMWDNATVEWFKGRTQVSDTLLHSFTQGSAERVGKAYLQLIWANAEKIGCTFGNLKSTWTSHTTKVSKPTYMQMVICHVEKTANHVGQPTYKPGKECSSCPSTLPHCGTKYAGLCSH